MTGKAKAESKTVTTSTPSRAVRQRADLAAEILRRARDETIFAHFFDLSPVPMAIQMLTTGDIVYANHGMVELTGYTLDELVDTTGAKLKLYPDKAQRRELLEILKANGRTSDFNLTVKSQDGQLHGPNVPRIAHVAERDHRFFRTDA